MIAFHTYPPGMASLLLAVMLVIALAPIMSSSTSAAAPVRSFSIADTSILQVGKADTLDVAVVSPSSSVSQGPDVVEKLHMTGVFDSVALVDALGDKPALAELQAYDAVLVYMDPNAYFSDYNSTTLGNTLADHVDVGGGVVVMDGLLFNSTITPIRGRFLREGYYAIDASASYAICMCQPRASLGTVYAPQHPILHGVTTFKEGTAYRSIGALTPGAMVLAEYSDGRPLVVEKEVAGGHRRIDLNFYPPSSDAYPGSGPVYWDSRTDGEQLMANALHYVATVGAGQDAFTYPIEPSQAHWVNGYDVHTPRSDPARCYHKPYDQIWHAGIDYGFRSVKDANGNWTDNTPIKAVADGIVRYSSKDPGTTKSYPGGAVIIEHTLADGSKIFSMYGHLDPHKILVSAVDARLKSVQKGQVIANGLKPQVSSSDNTHLHWEMRYFFDGSAIKLAPAYAATCAGVPGPGYTYPGHPDNFVANDGAGPTYRWTNPATFVESH